MLRTNLSTRPFYNERAVRALLMGLSIVALGLTLFNVLEIVRLRTQDSDARATIDRNNEQAARLRDQAQEIRRSIDQARLAVVQTAAAEANSLIDRRTFSWTGLLNQFQQTLPGDVRISGVALQVDTDGRRMVAIGVLSRRIEDLEEFMEALEKTGVFSGVLSRSDRPQDDGSLMSDVQAYYAPEAVPAAPASESGSDRPANQSPSGNVSAGGAR